MNNPKKVEINVDEDVIGDSFDLRKKAVPTGSSAPFYQQIVKSKDAPEKVSVLKLKGKIPELAVKPEDPVMKAPEGVAQQLQRQKTDAKAGCPIEAAIKSRRNAGSDKEVVKSDKPTEEVVTSIKLKGGDGQLAEVQKRPADQICQDAYQADESGGKGKNIAQVVAASGESQATMGQQLSAARKSKIGSQIYCEIEGSLSTRLEAGSYNERIKNDNAEEEKVTSFKIASSDYQLAEFKKRPAAQVCDGAVQSNEVAPKRQNIVQQVVSAGEANANLKEQIDGGNKQDEEVFDLQQTGEQVSKE